MGLDGDRAVRRPELTKAYAARRSSAGRCGQAARAPRGCRVPPPQRAGGGRLRAAGRALGAARREPRRALGEVRVRAQVEILRGVRRGAGGRVVEGALARGTLRQGPCRGPSGKATRGYRGLCSEMVLGGGAALAGRCWCREAGAWRAASISRRGPARRPPTVGESSLRSRRNKTQAVSVQQEKQNEE